MLVPTGKKGGWFSPAPRRTGPVSVTFAGGDFTIALYREPTPNTLTLVDETDIQLS